MENAGSHFPEYIQKYNRSSTKHFDDDDINELQSEVHRHVICNSNKKARVDKTLAFSIKIFTKMITH